MDQKLKEKTVASQEVFQGRIIKVRVDTVLLPDGGESNPGGGGAPRGCCRGPRY